MNEEWKIIDGYPNYSVSNLGRVRNDRRGNILKPHICGGADGGSYFQVTLYQGSHDSRKFFMIHRLVAEAFIPKADDTLEVNHIDGDHFNNAVSNLEWIGHKDNLIHAYKILNKKVAIGEPFAKKIVRVEDGKVFNSIIKAALACGLANHTGISQCLNGKPHRHTAGGYHWKYVDE